MTKVRCISETNETSKIFAQLEKIAKETNTPFSKLLAQSADNFLHMPLADKRFIPKDDIKFFDKMDKIRKLINESKGEDLIKIQKRHQQIGTLLNMRVSRLL